MNPEILLGTRLALHLATVALLCGYFQPAARFRLGPSAMAGLLLASSASLAFQICYGWADMVKQNPQPQLVLFVFAVFLPIAYTRGNVAKLFDQMTRLSPSKWFHR